MFPQHLVYYRNSAKKTVPMYRRLYVYLIPVLFI